MNSNRGYWAVLALIIIIGLGWWWYSKSNSSATQGSDTASTTEQTATSSQVTSVKKLSSSVVSIAESISGSSTFASWLRSTGVASQIGGKGPYTIFVPTDGSISQLPKGTFSNLSATQQKRFVQYHVISGRAVDVDAQVAGMVTALSGDPLNFSFGNQKIPMVNSAIIIAQYQGSNGMVYVIDNALIPPQK